MTDYNDGKIHGWNGGDCPVHPDSVISYWLRNELTSSNVEAGLCRWSHFNIDCDIIAFRVVKQYVELKTIWVNEYEDGCSTFNLEAHAKTNAASSATRIAVEYREVKK